jgi:DNA-binding NarL/FixJ family response regulator
MGVEPPARIWIIDREQWPRASLRAELIERGYDAVGFVRLADALVKLLWAPAEKPDAIVIDLGGQMDDPRLLAAVFRQRIPFIAIAGAAEAETPAVRQLPWAGFMQRPVTLGDVADALHALPAPAEARPGH